MHTYTHAYNIYDSVHNNLLFGTLFHLTYFLNLSFRFLDISHNNYSSKRTAALAIAIAPSKV